MPQPRLMKPGSEVIEDKAMNNLTVTNQQFSNDRATVDSGK